MAEKGAAGAELLPLQSQVELELQRSPQFLMKTYQLVDDPAVDDVISWSEGGSSFVVLRPVEFERDILPKHFNIDDFFSFVQRLDYLGFRKIVADRWEFRHACFRRGGEHLLSDICRLEWKMVWSYWLMAAAAPTSMVAGVVTFATLVVRMALGCPEAPVCALVDAMFRLPAKLDKLLVSYCHMMPRGAKDEIPLIKQDLERMIAFIQEHDDSGVEDRSMMVKCMTKEVRELSYDMEDSVDQYVHAADSRRGILSPRRKKYKITRRRSNKATEWLRKKLKWRLWMANKIREFSMRSEEALQQFSRFNHLGGISRSTTAASTRYGACFRSRRPTPNGEPIGIDSPMKKLEAWLGKDGEQKLKMVSVVGSGGIGKTTLVKQLYRRISGQFECRAYVRTSRKPDVRRLLISMLSQIRPHQSPRDWKVYSLIADIRTHLQDKRYLIVIDDVWATQTWDVLCRALPDGNLCSGILITTEVEDVALKCCGYDSKYVLTMKPLGHDDSRRLFFNTAFGSQLVCSPELGEAANGVIRKCAGLPLATVTLASLLVSQMGRQGVLDYINKSLGYGMKQVFDLSYNNLPQHLKACLMYLSIYQEDDVVQKDDVVKQWIAEGFIHATEQKGKEEISRRYFDELISSRMIQPEYRDDNDDVLSFSVHYMVLDLVTHKSIEENFVTAIDHCQTAAILADKVRRLALHFGNAEATSPTNMRLSQVRTLAFFGVFKCLPSIVEFGLLQVLILQLWDDDESISFDLTRISELFRLRYLHVTSNVTLEVQHTQMRGLQYLETLKIDARVSAVPSDIVHLPNLLHLSLPAGTNLPNGIGYMTSLCTLECFDLSVNSAENVQSLGVLTNLRDLRLTCSTLPSSSCYLKSKMDSMGTIIAKLSNLRSLTLEPSCILDSGSSNISISCEGLNRVSSPPLFLQRFEWLPRICTFSRLPNWIRHLYKLCVLKIGIRELARNDINVLGGLPALTVFSLYVRTKPAERIVFDKTGFSVLKYFKFRCSVLCVEFAEDAMPNLRKLKLGFNAHGADQHSTMPVGIEHLLGLTEISAKIGCVCTDDPDRRAAESTSIHAINMHPACPTFNIQCVDEMFSVEEEEYTTLQKQYEIMEGDSIEQHEVLRKGSEEDAHSRACPPCRMGEGSESSSEAQQYNIMENDSNKKHEIQEYSNQYAPGRLPKKRRMVVWNKQVRVRSAQDDLVGDDGFSWRKYRQKLIPGCKYPRVFYQCAHNKKKGCQATKQVQRTSNDPQLFNIACFGDHTCAHIERSPPGSQITHVEVRAGTPDDLFTDMMDTDILSAVAANNIPVTDDMPPYPDRFFDEPGDDSP